MNLREARQIVRQGVAEIFIIHVEKEMKGIPIPSDQLEYIGNVQKVWQSMI